MRSVLMGSPALDAYGQMALDDAALDSAAKDAQILRLYRWSGPAATFGYFQPYAEVLNQVSNHKVQGCSVVRRLTGGGLVYHDGDITFSLIFPWDRLTDATWIYKEIHRGIHLGLKSKGIKSRLWSPPAKQVQAPFACFAGPSPMDLVHEDGKKILGGALRRRRGMGLYQGSLRPEGLKARQDHVNEAVVAGIAQIWNAELRPQNVDDGLLDAALDLAEQKYRNDGWNKRR